LIRAELNSQKRISEPVQQQQNKQKDKNEVADKKMAKYFKVI
jgi:hypothetical protein